MIFGLLALVLQASPAQPSVEVRWVGPAQCVDEGQLGTLVVELAGVPPSPLELSVTGSADTTWHVEVTYEDTLRVVESEDCALLTEAVALIVAVRFDPIRTARQLEPTPKLAPPVVLGPVPDPMPVKEPNFEPESIPEHAASRPQRTRTQSRPALSPTVVIGVAGSLGPLPRGGVALRADAGLRRNALEVDLGAVATLGPESRARQGVTSSFRVFGGLVQACWVLESGRVSAPLCGRAEVGIVQGRPRGLENPNNVDALWLAPALRAGVGPSRGRFAPEGFLEVAAPLLRHQFEAVDVGRLHSLPPVALRLGIALRWRGRS